ncbi:MAG: site-2 protease family protein [Clostridia bacterium]|nr:site-2 protease family protein [Clostridia bacterium]
MASFFSFEKELVLLYGAIAAHEMAHLLACIVTKEKCLTITVNMFGMSLVCKPIKKCSHSIAVLISGPATNFLIYLALLPLISGESCNYYLRFFSYINLSLGIVNLIPITPLDGGNITKNLLQARIGVIAGSKISQRISDIFRMLIITIELFCISGSIFNPSVIMFTIFLWCARKKETELAMFDKKCILLGDTPKNKKLRYMTFDSESELLAVAEKISHSYYLIVAAFENGKFVGDINERELLFAIRKNCSLCTLKEYFEDKCP